MTELEEAAQSLKVFRDNLLAAQANQEVSLFDATDPAALIGLGGGGLRGCLWPALEFADGSPAEGLWFPLGSYGVGAVLPDAP